MGQCDSVVEATQLVERGTARGSPRTLMHSLGAFEDELRHSWDPRGGVISPSFKWQREEMDPRCLTPEPVFGTANLYVL